MELAPNTGACLSLSNEKKYVTKQSLINGIQLASPVQRGVHMEGKIGSERRHLQRFSVKAVALVQTASPGTHRVFELCTQDISSGGAFFPMEVPLPTGEKIKITLFLSFSALERISDFPSTAKIITEGQVLRSTKQGMAVEFDRHYEMSPVAL
jgi:hypothetical protein